MNCHSVLRIVIEERQSLMQLAYQGQMELDQYREAVLRLCGVTQPLDLERNTNIRRRRQRYLFL
jgi:hypothetical protein